MAGDVGATMRHKHYGSCWQMSRHLVLHSLTLAYAEVVEFVVACLKAGESVVARRQKCYRKRLVQMRTKCVKPSFEIATWTRSVDVQINHLAKTTS